MAHFLVTFVLSNWLQIAKRIRALPTWEVPVLAPFKVDRPIYNLSESTNFPYYIFLIRLEIAKVAIDSSS